MPRSSSLVSRGSARSTSPPRATSTGNPGGRNGVAGDREHGAEERGVPGAAAQVGTTSARSTAGKAASRPKARCRARRRRRLPRRRSRGSRRTKSPSPQAQKTARRRSGCSSCSVKATDSSAAMWAPSSRPVPPIAEDVRDREAERQQPEVEHQPGDMPGGRAAAGEHGTDGGELGAAGEHHQRHQHGLPGRQPAGDAIAPKEKPTSASARQTRAMSPSVPRSSICQAERIKPTDSCAFRKSSPLAARHVESVAKHARSRGNLEARPLLTGDTTTTGPANLEVID